MYLLLETSCLFIFSSFLLFENSLHLFIFYLFVGCHQLPASSDFSFGVQSPFAFYFLPYISYTFRFLLYFSYNLFRKSTLIFFRLFKKNNFLSICGFKIYPFNLISQTSLLFLLDVNFVQLINCLHNQSSHS